MPSMTARRMSQVLRILDKVLVISHSYVVKLSKQQLGLMIVAGAGLCALAVDHFILRPDGALSAAAAAIVVEEGSPLEGEPKGKAIKAIIDRSSALIADRIDRTATERKIQPRDAFCEPWKVTVETEVQAIVDSATTPVPVVSVKAPWKLTSVSSIGGKLAVVLEWGSKSIVLTLDSGIKDNAELLSASDAYGKDVVPSATVREVTTGTVFKLSLDAQTATSERR